MENIGLIATVLESLKTGFIPGSRGSFLLDFIAVAIFFLLLLQTLSIFLVRKKRRFRSHQRIQQVIAAVLFITILLFELEMRIWGWTERAKASPFFANVVYKALYVHIVFAVLCFVLWSVTLYFAYKGFAGEENLGASHYRGKHRKLAVPAAVSLYCTCITGWLFYWLAFIAS